MLWVSILSSSLVQVRCIWCNIAYELDGHVVYEYKVCRLHW